MNSSASPGTVGKRRAIQSSRAAAMRAREVATKFQTISRGPSSGAPPSTKTRAGPCARTVTARPSMSTPRVRVASASPSTVTAPSTG